MKLYLIRLLVALVTFVVGIGASALWATLRPAKQSHFETKTLVVVKREEAAPQATTDTVKVIRGGILQGKAISKPAPAYPAIARAARASGTVVVDIVVGESGDVVSATATSGHPLLQQAAVDAVRQWKFSPTRLSGEPVKVSGQVLVNFAIK